MLTVVCGEDTVTSRKYYQDLKEEYKNKNYEIRAITTSEIEELHKWLFDAPSLFANKPVFFIDGLLSYLKKYNPKSTIEQIMKIIQVSNNEIFTWESKLNSYDLKSKAGLKELIKLAKIKEFKPSENIFKLLDSFFPTNKSAFIRNLGAVSANIDENFIFIMLVRLVRNLILAKEQIIPSVMQKWQFVKIRSQAGFWQKEKLISLYEALLRIETRSKTNKSAFSITHSLDILACYYL